MMGAVWSSFVFILSLAVFALPRNGFAESLRGSAVPVQFAVLLDDGDPIQGEAVCVLGKTCLLLERENPNLRVSVALSQQNDQASELQIECSTSCSFQNYSSSIAFSYERQFSFFEGKDFFEVPLVLKVRKRLGQVLLILPKNTSGG